MHIARCIEAEASNKNCHIDIYFKTKDDNSLTALLTERAPKYGSARS